MLLIKRYEWFGFQRESIKQQKIPQLYIYLRCQRLKINKITVYLLLE